MAHVESVSLSCFIKRSKCGQNSLWHALCETSSRVRFGSEMLLCCNIGPKSTTTHVAILQHASRSVRRVFRDHAVSVEFRMFLKSAIYALIGTLCQGVLSAEGADWVFRQSWFSDAPAVAYQSAGPDAAFAMSPLPPHAMPNSRSAYRPAIPQRGPGFAIRSKSRWNIYRLNSGRSYDTTIYREFSFEESP